MSNLSYEEQGRVLFRAVEGGGFDDLMGDGVHANRIRARIREFDCDPNLWSGIVGETHKGIPNYYGECAAADFGRAWRGRQQLLAAEEYANGTDPRRIVSLAWPE